MEQASASFPRTSYQFGAPPTEAASLVQSSLSDGQSPGLRGPSQRRTSPKSKTTRSPPARINTSQAASKNSKSTSAGLRSGTNHSAIAAMSGTISPVHEITYTPTTHRISKAKKGKKVHACEFPGCEKIFTRAEHRKRHEANHNVVPAFQCDIEGCRKPFQRADLLTRHMERQHNVPVASPSSTSQPRRSSSTTSTAYSNPTTPNVVRPTMPPQPLGLSPQAIPMPQPQPTRAVSIGSLVDNHRTDYAPHSFQTSFNNATHLPVPPAAAHGLPTDLVYGLSASDSPYNSSESCYSPSNVSDLIAPLPQIATQQPYFPSQEELARPQSASVDCGFPQTVFAQYSWEQPPMTAPLQGFQYPSPTFMGAEQMGIPYDISVPFEGWSAMRKMTF